jgi:hypothetical protein
MQAQTTIEPTARRHSMLARLLGLIRGDKYMAGAYPPEMPLPADAPAGSHPKER